MQSSVYCLRVLVIHPQEITYQRYPPLHVIIQPCCLYSLVTYESAKVLASGDHPQPHPLKEGLRSGNVLQVYDQDALSRLQELSPQWPPPLEIL